MQTVYTTANFKGAWSTKRDPIQCKGPPATVPCGTSQPGAAHLPTPTPFHSRPISEAPPYSASPSLSPSHNGPSQESSSLHSTQRPQSKAYRSPHSCTLKAKQNQRHACPAGADQGWQRNHNTRGPCAHSHLPSTSIVDHGQAQPCCALKMKARNRARAPEAVQSGKCKRGGSL